MVRYRIALLHIAGIIFCQDEILCPSFSRSLVSQAECVDLGGCLLLLDNWGKGLDIKPLSIQPQCHAQTCFCIATVHGWLQAALYPILSPSYPAKASSRPGQHIPPELPALLTRSFLPCTVSILSCPSTETLYFCNVTLILQYL